MKAYATETDKTPPQTDFHTDTYRSKITAITTNDNIVPATATESWDISAGWFSNQRYVR